MNDVSNPARDVEQVTSGRMTLLLIAGIPVIVILASTWMWYYVASGKLDVVGALGTANRGELVRPPRQAMEAGWSNASNADFEPVTPPQWTLIVPHRGVSCDATCERRLYTTRQIHMALGKELGRVTRMFVADAPIDSLTLGVDALSDARPLPASFDEYVARDQRGMTVWQSESDSFAKNFPEYLANQESWYVMDPNGWVMMRYDNDISYKDVISDLKFLIKNSNG